MVRSYEKKNCKKRTYGYSSEKSLQDAVSAVVKDGLSFRKASERFHVKKSTLYDHYHGKHSKKVGRPQVLSAEIEDAIAAMLDQVAEWGYPVGRLELMIIVRDILKIHNKTVGCFSNNTPGDDWINNFIRRNRMSKRAASNIRRSRASIDEENVNEFFDNLERVYEKYGPLPPEHIYNYDETNQQDDPGNKRVFVRRGRRRVENVGEHSKCSFSTMWCGNAVGQILPPMVVYRAKNVYEGWKARGIKGAVYSSSPSGWFDADTFAQWFQQVFLPYATLQEEGPKILFGDNLSSHFNPEVVRLAKVNNIFFVMLPAHGTHLLQPLDVSVFGPMKEKWRNELESWRKESRIRKTLPKEYFPMLLKRLATACSATIGKNLISGFETCGLYPLDRTQVLSKLPKSLDLSRSVAQISETLISLLEENRKPSATTRKRGKKAEPGVVLEAAELEKDNSERGDSARKGYRDDSKNQSISSTDNDGQVAGPSGLHLRQSTRPRKKRRFFEDIEFDYSAPRPEDRIEEELCSICGRVDDDEDADTDDDDGGTINWTGCDECGRWFHLTCLQYAGFIECKYCEE